MRRKMTGIKDDAWGNTTSDSAADGLEYVR